MPARITVCYADRPAIESLLFENRDYRLGRSAQCDLVVKHPTVSREHALVTHSAMKWRLNDSQSQNGTRVNGDLIKNSNLSGNELISIGSVDCLFEIQTEQQISSISAHNTWRLKQSRIEQAKLTKSSLLQGLDERLFSLISLTGTQRGLIMIGEQLDQLKVFAVKGMSQCDFTESFFEGSVGAMKKSIENRQPVVSMDVSGDPLWSQRESIKKKNIATLACVPIYNENQLIGVVYLDSKKSGKLFSALDFEIMRTICSQIELNVQALIIHDQVDILLKQLPAHQTIINLPVLSLAN